jgi:hypothetical protein
MSGSLTKADFRGVRCDHTYTSYISRATVGVSFLFIMRCTFITAIAERVENVFKNDIKLISSSSASRQYNAVDYLVSLCISSWWNISKLLPVPRRLNKTKRGGEETHQRGSSTQRRVYRVQATEQSWQLRGNNNKTRIDRELARREREDDDFHREMLLLFYSPSFPGCSLGRVPWWWALFDDDDT